jgi:hypothetical protein
MQSKPVPWYDARRLDWERGGSGYNDVAFSVIFNGFVWPFQARAGEFMGLDSWPGTTLRTVNDLQVSP